MEVKAKLRHLRQSPRKVRLVADVIKGLDVQVAQNQLQFLNKRAVRPVLKLLNSSIANAENNFQLKKDNLYIKDIRVDQGPTTPRWKPRAFGRATPIKKKTSHVVIVLSEKVASTQADKAKKDKAKIKDTKVVKSLDEIKKGYAQKGQPGVDKVDKTKKTAKIKTGHAPEPVDISRLGKDRDKQHLDQLKKKDKGGFIKRMFRRKSV